MIRSIRVLVSFVFWKPLAISARISDPSTRHRSPGASQASSCAAAAAGTVPSAKAT